MTPPRDTLSSDGANSFRAVRRSTSSIPAILMLVGIFGPQWRSLADDASTEPVVWDSSFEVRTKIGYKSNVVERSGDSEGSMFGGAEFEALLFKIMPDGGEVSFLLSAEDTRYFSSAEVNHEDLVLFRGQIKKPFASAWKWGVLGQYVYQDQVYDASITEDTLRTVQAKGHSLLVRPSLRWSFHSRNWVELETDTQRQFFEAPLDSYWQAGPRLTLGHTFDDRSEVALSYSYQQRLYDDRLPLDLTRSPIPGDELKFHQHEVAVGYRRTLDEKGRWRLQSKVGYTANEDNGVGYFDYGRWFTSLDLLFRTNIWEAGTRLRYSRHEFPNQDGDSGDDRSRDAISVEPSVSLRINKRWKVGAGYEFRRYSANLSVDDYDVQTGSAFLSYEF